MNFRRLIFVYKTDANPVSIVAEFVREVMSDDSHQCTLCHLTYQGFFKKREWTSFVEELPLPSTFYLRSRFLTKQPSLRGSDFPAVFIEDDTGTLHELVGADELRSATSLEELMVLVRTRLFETI